MSRLTDNSLLGIADSLKAHKRIHLDLDGVGHLSIDRHLPFLVLYRRPKTFTDEGTQLLATTEAAYLLSSEGREVEKDLRRLLDTMADYSREKFGVFLLLEIWSRRPEQAPISDSSDGLDNVGFRVFTSPDNDRADTIVSELHKSLRNIKVRGKSARVEIPDNPRDHRERPAFLFKKGSAGVVQVGIELEPCWRDRSTDQLFPVVIRSLRRKMSKALRRSLYHFIRQETTQRPKDFNVLGRRQVKRAVWEIDRKLDEITLGFDFLLCLNPTNTAGLWNEFKRSRFEKTPTLRYRPLPLDVSLAKRRLFAIPIEKVEDPSLEHLFRQKQDELDRQFTMLKDRSTPRFILGAYQLYGRIGATLIRQAEEILERIHGSTGGGHRNGSLRYPEIREMAQEEVSFYASKLDGPSPRIIPSSNLVAGLTVSEGNLLIDPSLRLSKNRARALIHHEVGTHMLTFLNGRRQPLTQLRSGLAAYEELQEGLAVFAEYMAGGLDKHRLRTLAGRVLAADSVLSGASFIDTFRYLCRYGFAAKNAFSITLRVHRGGGFIKDFIYLRGFAAVLDYLRSGKDLTKLYIGKIALKHVEIMDELGMRGVVRPPALLPRFLDFPQYEKRLASIKNHLHIYELLSE